MSKNSLIYVTYPDNLSELDSSLDQFVELFIERFSLVLQRLMGQDISIIAKGRDFDAASKLDYLKKADRVLFFIHPSFTDVEDYMSELNQACTQLKVTDIDHINGSDKLFKVVLSPLKLPLESEVLQTLMPYEYYERNAFNRRVKMLDITDEGKSSSFFSRLLDLGYDIKRSVKGDESLFQVENEKEKTVYLGLATHDQLQAREEIRRELMHYGFRVLPAINFPMQGEEFREILLENLHYCNTVIQIMGSTYGEVLKGTKYSLPDFQNMVIREYQQQAEPEFFQRYIWIPQNLKINDQRQSLYLKRLRRDDAGMNTEVIESPLETFKTILAKRLTVSNNNHSDGIGNLSKVYILTEEELGNDYEQLYNTLSLSGLKVLTLDYGEQTGLYARHLQALRETDGVIIYQQKNNEFWLSSKLRDIIKAPGIGREKPFNRIIISSHLKPDEKLLNMIRAQIEIINPEGSGPEVILQKLTSA